MGAGRCLGPEGNGVSLGEGGRKGPAPRKQGRLAVNAQLGKSNMEKEEEGRTSQA
jgi:hypothetical protein